MKDSKNPVDLASIDLAQIRREIDLLDEEIHQALVKRARLVEAVAIAKGLDGSTPGTMALRPAREAEILLKRLQRNQGRLPSATIARIWREIVASMTALQGPLEVLVGTQSKSVGYFELARDCFGSSTPMSLQSSPIKAVREISRREGTIAVVPMPNMEDEEPWWPLLAAPPFKLKIIGHLPLIDKHPGRFEDMEAFLVCGDPVDITQSDVTCVVVSTNLRLAPNQLAAVFAEKALQAEVLAVQNPSLGQDQWNYFITLRGDGLELTAMQALCQELVQGQEHWRDLAIIGGYIARSSGH